MSCFHPDHPLPSPGSVPCMYGVPSPFTPQDVLLPQQRVSSSTDVQDLVSSLPPINTVFMGTGGVQWREKQPLCSDRHHGDHSGAFRQLLTVMAWAGLIWCWSTFFFFLNMVDSMQHANVKSRSSKLFTVWNPWNASSSHTVLDLCWWEHTYLFF